MRITVVDAKWSLPFFFPDQKHASSKKGRGWSSSEWEQSVEFATRIKETEIWSMTARAGSFVCLLPQFQTPRTKIWCRLQFSVLNLCQYAQILMQTNTSEMEHLNRIQLTFKFFGYNIWLPEPIEVFTTIINQTLDGTVCFTFVQFPHSASPLPT